jgi:hypothetical protein
VEHGVPQEQDGIHGAERIAYVAMPAGCQYDNEGDAMLGAGRVEGVTHEWKTVVFDDPFSASPVVLTQCASYNGHGPVEDLAARRGLGPV